MSTGAIETIEAKQQDGHSPAGNPTDAVQAQSAEVKPVITYLLLIRHGENDWVTTHRLAGRTPGVHLNDKGRQQSLELSTFLASQPISVIYSSPLERCLQTAQPLAEAKQLPVEQEAGLLEVEYGDWRGGDLRELAKLPEWRLVQHYPSSFRFPAGETLYEVQARAVRTLDELRLRHAGKLVAVFSHGDVIRLSVAHFLGIPIDLFQRIQISTASVSVIVLHDSVPSVMGVNYLTSLPVMQVSESR